MTRPLALGWLGNWCRWGEGGYSSAVSRRLTPSAAVLCYRYRYRCALRAVRYSHTASAIKRAYEAKDFDTFIPGMH
jgi:hypothetical protein